MGEPVDSARILEQLKAGAPAVLAQYPVRLAYVYGSVARGAATALSDVDVGVLFDDDVSSYDQLMIALELDWRLREGSGTSLEVEVGQMNNMPLLLLGAIVTEGVPIYARDETYRLAYEQRIRDECAIERPRLEAYYRAYMRNLMEMLGG